MKHSTDLPNIDVLTLTLGSDQSLTMASATRIDTSYIHKVCLAALNYKGPSIIGFDAIAAPNDSALLRLILLAPLPCNGNSMSKRAAISEKNRKIQRINLFRIEKFLQGCQRRLETAKAYDDWTDLNGYFVKINRFHSEPQFARAVKLSFIQTDGDHDAMVMVNGQSKRVRSLHCPEWVGGLQLYSSNWSSQYPDCNFRMLESHEGFLDFFTQFINKQQHDNANSTSATR